MPQEGPVQSIDRVFTLIELLAQEPNGMSLKDLASLAGLHVSTTHRLLAALGAREYVYKDLDTGKYRLTLKLFEVAGQSLGGMNVVSVARPHLEFLAAHSGESIHLVTRHLNEIVYLYKIDNGVSLSSMGSFVGRRNPMYCTGLGKSILAELSDAEISEIWSSSTIQKRTDHTLTTLPELMEELQRTRNRGYAIDNEENEPGVFCIAKALKDFTQSPFGAISISMPKIRVTEEAVNRLSQEVIQVAQTISILLGYKNPPHSFN